MTNRIAFPRTTAPQRHRLFEPGDATGAVDGACHPAPVGRRPCYAGKPRFVAGGDAALAHFARRAPLRPRRTAVGIEHHGIALRQDHPAGGKQRRADDRANAHGGTPLVSPPTVNRILRTAGRGTTPPPAATKGGYRSVAARPRDSARPSTAIAVGFLPVMRSCASCQPSGVRRAAGLRNDRPTRCRHRRHLGRSLPIRRVPLRTRCMPA